MISHCRPRRSSRRASNGPARRNPRVNRRRRPSTPHPFRMLRAHSLCASQAPRCYTVRVCARRHRITHQWSLLVSLKRDQPRRAALGSRSPCARRTSGKVGQHLLTKPTLKRNRRSFQEMVWHKTDPKKEPPLFSGNGVVQHLVCRGSRRRPLGSAKASSVGAFTRIPKCTSRPGRCSAATLAYQCHRIWASQRDH